MNVFGVIFVTLIFKTSIQLAKSAGGECQVDQSKIPASLRIKEKILCNYDKDVRPVKHDTHTVTLMTTLMLKYIDYEMHSGSFSAHTWLVVRWNDDHLKWTPKDYDNNMFIHLSSDSIWVPDLVLYNKNDLGDTSDLISGVKCLVFHTGTIACVVPTRHESVCLGDLRKWPFDVQTCSMNFGSWVFSGEELNLTLSDPPIKLSDYSPNPEWKLLNSSGRIKVTKFSNNTYPIIIYTFKVQRHSAMHISIIVVPAIVLVMMTLVTMWLDPEASDRLILASISIFGHFIYTQHLNWEIPVNGPDPPLIVNFFRDSMLLTGFTIFFTLVIRAMISTKKETPGWLTSVSSFIINSRPGQILLLAELSPQGAAALSTKSNTDDNTDLVEPSPGISKTWFLIGKLLDKVLLFVYLVTYFGLFITLLV